MERKKIVNAVVLIIILITVVVFVVVSVNKFLNRNKQTNTVKKGETQQEVINQSLPKLKCDLASDGDYQSKASTEGQIDLCSCIKNDEQKKTCVTAATDMVYFKQARQQFSLETCEKMSVAEAKDSCKAMVNSGIDELKKNNPELLAYLYSQQNNYDGSIQLLNDTLAKNPSDVDVILSLATIYAGRAIAEHKESEYVSKAFELVNKAIELNPNNPEAYRVQGYVNEAKPDYSAAVMSYNKSLELDQNYILSYVGRGHTYNMQGQLDEALADFKKAKELDTDKKHPEIYSNLCRLEASSPYIDDAIENCKITVSLPSSNLSTKSGAYGVLGEMYIRAKRYDEAEAQLNLALASNLNDANTYVIMAKMDNLKSEYDLALNNSHKAVNIDPLKSSAYIYIAESLLKKNNLDDSIAAGLKGLDLVDKDVSLLLPNKNTTKKEIYNVLTQAYGKKGDKVNEDKYKTLADGIK